MIGPRDRMLVPYGELTLLTHTGADETELSYDVRPAAGDEWLILFAANLHDDSGGNQSLAWRLYDGTNTIYLRDPVSVASGVRCMVGMAEDYKGPCILTGMLINHDTYLISSVGALGGGKKLTTQVAYYKMPSGRDDA